MVFAVRLGSLSHFHMIALELAHFHTFLSCRNNLVGVQMRRKVSLHLSCSISLQLMLLFGY
jgi:hypothetical protein